MVSSTIKKLKEHANSGKQYPAELSKLFREMMQTNDRAAAIVGRSILEGHLADMFKRHMRKMSREREDALFSGDGPLATFSSKTRLAYALKFISEEQNRNINFIREIRNAFAHTTNRLRFADPPVKAVCDLLETASPLAAKKAFQHPRKKFLLVVVDTGAELDAIGSDEGQAGLELFRAVAQLGDEKKSRQ